MPDEADELYGLDPTDFVAARNDLAKRLRKEGNKARATEVTKLKRPSPAAWAVNQLARRHRDDLGELVRLGEQLQSAQEGALGGGEPADLRRAGRARRDAVSRLAGMAEAILGERGGGAATHAGEVAATLEAASLDEGAGAAVLAGRLTEALSPPSGFGVFDDPSPVTPLSSARRRKSAQKQPETDGPDESDQPDQRSLRARREAEDAATKARQRWEECSAQARTAVAFVAERRRTVTEAEAEVGRLDDLMTAAQRRLGEAVRSAEVAEDAASQAEDATSRATSELRQADERVRGLTGDDPGVAASGPGVDAR